MNIVVSAFFSWGAKWVKHHKKKGGWKKKLVTLFIPLFFGKKNLSIFEKKIPIIFCHISFYFDFRLRGILFSRFSLFWQVLKNLSSFNNAKSCLDSPNYAKSDKWEEKKTFEIFTKSSFFSYNQHHKRYSTIFFFHFNFKFIYCFHHSYFIPKKK